MQLQYSPHFEAGVKVTGVSDKTRKMLLYSRFFLEQMTVRISGTEKTSSLTRATAAPGKKKKGN